MSNNSQRVGFDTERSATGDFSASFTTIGSPLAYNPVIIIFDNQTTVSVQLSVDGTNVWKTFAAGEALLLDLRANHGIASNYTIDANTQFYVKGSATAGTDSFRISVLYARN